jgi:hypothetical protein
VWPVASDEEANPLVLVIGWKDAEIEIGEPEQAERTITTEEHDRQIAGLQRMLRFSQNENATWCEWAHAMMLKYKMVDLGQGLRYELERELSAQEKKRAKAQAQSAVAPDASMSDKDALRWLIDHEGEELEDTTPGGTRRVFQFGAKGLRHRRIGERDDWLETYLFWFLGRGPFRIPRRDFSYDDDGMGGPSE